jgi:hypothetical protein
MRAGLRICGRRTIELGPITLGMVVAVGKVRRRHALRQLLVERRSSCQPAMMFGVVYEVVIIECVIGRCI